MTAPKIETVCPDCGGWHAAVANERYEALKVQACTALDASTPEIYHAFGIDAPGGRWDIDDDTATIRFTGADGRAAAARFQFIGTFARRSDTFKWGWDHPATTELNRHAADRARATGQQIGSDILTSNLVTLPEAEVWHLAKITAHLSDLPATYRVPASAPGTPQDAMVWWYLAFDRPAWEPRA